MKVCFIVSQIFAWGKYGGFGSMTRALGKGLSEKGINVSAVTLQRPGQPAVQELDGIRVISYPPSSFLTSGKLYKECDADIYHSQEPTAGTYLAQKSMPDKKHIITSIDPRTDRDWMVEARYFSLKQKIKTPLTYFYEKNYFIKKAVQKSDAVYCQAKYIIPKTKALYDLNEAPGFLPSPVTLPKTEITKAKEPTICFVARFDRRKRPELFLDLASKFPHVKFIAVGKAHDEKYDAHLRKKYAIVPNLEMTGFIDQFASSRLEEILERSWIMVNTAAREGLPASFLEAAAYKCAILSSNNPDGFSQNFGYHVKDEDYASGLKCLLETNRWKALGEKGHAYIKETHELNVVIEKHIKVYQELLNR